MNGYICKNKHAHGFKWGFRAKGNLSRQVLITWNSHIRINKTNANTPRN